MKQSIWTIPICDGCGEPPHKCYCDEDCPTCDKKAYQCMAESETGECLNKDKK